MQKKTQSFLLALGVLCSIAANCGGSESKQAVQATLSSGDLSIVAASLQSLTGERFGTTSTEHFTIVHEIGAAGIAGTGRALESAYGHFYDVFVHAGFQPTRSPDRLVWICFPQQGGFNDYALRAEGMDLSWLDGYYSMQTNRVAVVQPNPRFAERETVISPPRPDEARVVLVANSRPSEQVLPMSPGQSLDLTRLTHELAHQLAFNSGIQTRGVMYPLWVSEGLATNFESEGPAKENALPSNRARRGCLAATCAAGEMAPLRELIVRTRVPADPRASRQYYAQAWAFFRFLLTEHPRSLRAYLDRIGKLPAGSRDTQSLTREFAEVFGAPESLEPAWNTFVARQIQSAPAEEAEAGPR